MLCERARRAKAAIAYVNMVGGQDELVFDGGSLVIDPEGEVVARFPQFEEHSRVVDVPLGEAHGIGSPEREAHPTRSTDSRQEPDSLSPLPELRSEEEIYEALKLGLSDYVRKNGFKKVVVGLSGGIDSTLTAAIAADAVGAGQRARHHDAVEFSSGDSVDGLQGPRCEPRDRVARDPHRRGVARRTWTRPGEAFGKHETGLAEENLQARIRGNILMAISNRYGHLVVATGNKSEMACGYATLYGDMAGGFALLKDVFKTEVYELARFRNDDHVRRSRKARSRKPRRPSCDRTRRTPTRLPPYDVLDPILEAYIEEDVADLRHRRPGLRSGDGPEGDHARGPGRVQAAPGAAGAQGHDQGVRTRPPAADNQRVARPEGRERLARSIGSRGSRTHGGGVT